MGVMSRIEDVLYADYVTRNPTQAGKKRNPLKESPMTSPGEDTVEMNSRTLLDFMGWGSDQNDSELKKDIATDDPLKDDGMFLQKPGNIVTNKKTSYLDTLGGLRSPTA